MITVWGRATSSNVQIVMWALAEIGLDCERHDVGGAFGKTDTPEYIAMNPNRLVPTIQDGELTLWESGAIVRYLGAQYGNEQFWPSDPKLRAGIDKWAEWSKTSFGPAVLAQIFTQLIALPAEKRDPKVLEAGIARVATLAPMIDKRLSETPFLGGQNLAFADCIFGTLLYRYFTMPFERVATPNLEAYYNRLGERPAYRKHAMVSYESLRAK
jgi:glutathione S-transferase